MADVTARWAGAQDATAGSTYKVEYTLNNVDWILHAADQAATAPYTPVTSSLANSSQYGAISITLVDGTNFGTSGYAYVGSALVQWTGKNINVLTGVTWHSGAGTYSASTPVIIAHESSLVTGVLIELGVMLWRITHTNAAGLVSFPAYFWYFVPPVSPSDCCVVITRIQSDLGFSPRVGVNVTAYLEDDISFAHLAGGHLDKGQGASTTQETNAFGITFHQCIISNSREDIGGGDSPYIFILDSGTENSLTLRVDTIPAQHWVLLSQIATEVVYE